MRLAELTASLRFLLPFVDLERACVFVKEQILGILSICSRISLRAAVKQGVDKFIHGAVGFAVGIMPYKPGLIGEHTFSGVDIFAG